VLTDRRSDALRAPVGERDGHLRLRAGLPHADDDEAADAGGLRAGDGLVGPGGKVGSVEVAVRIDQHRE
jgi:hypothetical protein